jgi:hemerythrin
MLFVPWYINNPTKPKEKTDGPHTSALLEHNLFIIWKPEYNLGIPIIDDQHRGIVAIINSLYFGTQCSHVSNILAPTIGMLRSYAQIHFQIEEYFLEIIDYPELLSHRLLHQEYNSKLAEIERKSMLDKDPYQLMVFLKKWWLVHICEEDTLYRSLLCNGMEKKEDQPIPIACHIG